MLSTRLRLGFIAIISLIFGVLAIGAISHTEVNPRHKFITSIRTSLSPTSCPPDLTEKQSLQSTPWPLSLLPTHYALRWRDCPHHHLRKYESSSEADLSTPINNNQEHSRLDIKSSFSTKDSDYAVENPQQTERTPITTTSTTTSTTTTTKEKTPETKTRQSFYPRRKDNPISIPSLAMVTSTSILLAALLLHLGWIIVWRDGLARLGHDVSADMDWGWAGWRLLGAGA